VKLKSPVFESQTKKQTRQHGNPELGRFGSQVRGGRFPPQKPRKRQEPGRKNRPERTPPQGKLNSVKKEAKEAQNALRLKSPISKTVNTIWAAKKHGEESMLFLTEGQSAGGSIISARDVLTQAIFTLKGKPEKRLRQEPGNHLPERRAVTAMMMALGIEESVENLRYNKIILATDADVDGFHIRNLLMTFFLQLLRGTGHHPAMCIFWRPRCFGSAIKRKRVIAIRKKSVAKPARRFGPRSDAL